MKIKNGSYTAIEMRWDTFTYPIKPGTPVSLAGVFANNSAAVGIIPQEIKEKPLDKNGIICVNGEILLSDIPYELSDDAIKAISGIEFFGDDGRPKTFPYVLPEASASAIGGVKMAANVSEAAGEAPTAAEYKALLDALIEAGIMAAPPTA